MQFEWNGQKYQPQIWSPEIGVIGYVIAVDAETELIQEGKIPAFIIGQAYAGGGRVYFLHLEHLSTFLDIHRNQIFVMQNAAFDIAVLTQETGFDFDVMIRSQRLWDTSILYRLLNLATIGTVPNKFNLSLLSEELLGIALDKSMEVRGAFGKYRKGLQVDYNTMANRELQYAALDAIATFQIYEQLFPQVEKISPGKYLTHKIQLMGEIALAEISRNGFGIGPTLRLNFLAEQDRRIGAAKEKLAEYDYLPGRKGNQKKMFEIIKQLDVHLPLTKTGKPSIKEENLKTYRESRPVIDAYLNFKAEEKLKSFIVKLDKPRIHTKFNGILVTGRTSSVRPCLQTLPKDKRVRSLFVPSQGSIFIIADYKQLELCTLAQECLDKFGTSKMAEMINARCDLHQRFASIITEKPEDQITKEERTRAKACNFGFPGGLGIQKFTEYAQKSYGIVLSAEGAKALKEKWLAAFPEMRLYLEDNLAARHDFSSLKWCDNPEIAVAIFKRIARGATLSTKGQPYSKETIHWALTTVLDDLAPQYSGISRGSEEVLRAAIQESVATRTGRIRAKTDYCAVKNTPFQGLAADGAKIALYRLIRAKYRVVNFIHDEIIIEVPKNSDIEGAKQSIKGIMIESMQAVVPNVLIDAEITHSDSWAKP